MALRFRKTVVFRAVSTSTRPLATTRSYASKSDPSSSDSKKDDFEGLGVIGKGDKKARPVILSHSAPTDSEDPDVRKHNEEFEKRPDRAANIVDDKKEEVDKEFWKGML